MRSLKGDSLQGRLHSPFYLACPFFLGERGKARIAVIDAVTHDLRTSVNHMMPLCSMRALGAMAFTVGKRHRLAWPDGQVVGTVYILQFCLCVILGRWVDCGLQHHFKFSRNKRRVILVLAISSSDRPFPRLMARLGKTRLLQRLSLAAWFRLATPSTPTEPACKWPLAALFVAKATTHPAHSQPAAHNFVRRDYHLKGRQWRTRAPRHCLVDTLHGESPTLPRAGKALSLTESTAFRSMFFLVLSFLFFRAWLTDLNGVATS